MKWIKGIIWFLKNFHTFQEKFQEIIKDFHRMRELYDASDVRISGVTVENEKILSENSRLRNEWQNARENNASTRLRLNAISQKLREVCDANGIDADTDDFILAVVDAELSGEVEESGVIVHPTNYM